MDCLNCDEKCYCVGECSFCSKDFDCAGECQCFFLFLTPFTLSNFFLDLLCFCGTFLFIKLWPKINLRPLSFVIICAKRSYFGNSESGRENSICSMIYDWNEEFNWQNLLAKILFAITITLLSSYWNYCQHIGREDCIYTSTASRQGWKAFSDRYFWSSLSQLLGNSFDSLMDFFVIIVTMVE